MPQTAVMQTIGAPWLGIVIPLSIFAVSFALAWLLFRHFSQKVEEGEVGPVD